MVGDILLKALQGCASASRRMIEMEISAFLSLPEGMIVEQVQMTETQLTVVALSTKASACCPGCGCPSEHVHSQYQRTVNDVPCGGRNVVLRLGVRKFFCLTLTCPRKVFAERLPDLVEPWARVSNRLLEELKAIGLSASAEVSERLVPRLAMKVKAPTMLRYLRAIPPPAKTAVRILGIDDFAMRRGDRYGTLLVNLETRRPLDLLPDRTAEAVLPWLLKHQEIEVVSRDRASAYADAVKRALPHAIQVADRYHLIGNLREHVQRLLDRKRTCLPFVEDTSLKGTGASRTAGTGLPADLSAAEVPMACPQRLQAAASVQPPEAILPEPPREQDSTEVEISCLTYAERKKKISRDKRSARYEEVMALHQTGMGQRAIARTLGVSRKVVQHFVSSPAFPERAEGSGLHLKGKSKLDPYLAYLRERWDAGIHKGSRLFREIKERGYTGCSSLLGKLLSEWRAQLPPEPRQGNPRKPRLAAAQQRGQRRLSSRSASFMMILPPEKLTSKEQHQMEQICQASEELRTVYLLSQKFVTLLKGQQAEALDGWLKQAKECHVSELSSFVNGIRRDYAAVRAAFALPWSNGITEGHVNRLKFLKRQMFGRAHLDLLRVKVLHAV
jgi:transposase